MSEIKQNAHRTTSWLDATKEVRKRALKVHLLHNFLFLLFCFLFELFLLYSLIDGKYLFEFDFWKIIFLVIFIVFPLIIISIYLLRSLITIYKLLKYDFKYCNAKITDVKVHNKYGRYRRIEYEITFKFGDKEKSEITVYEGDFSKNFNPRKYEGAYITVVTSNIKYFIFIKNYKVSAKPH